MTMIQPKMGAGRDWRKWALFGITDPDSVICTAPFWGFRTLLVQSWRCRCFPALGDRLQASSYNFVG